MRTETKDWTNAEIQKKIDSISDYLKSHNYLVINVLAEDLIAYFDGEAPSGDTTTIEQVLDSKWLLIHEVVEMSELKKQGHSISFDLLVTQPETVFEAHLVAVEWEFQIAKKEGAHEWIKKQLVDVKNWLEDPGLKSELITKCQQLLERYSSNHISQEHSF